MPNAPQDQDGPDDQSREAKERFNVWISIEREDLDNERSKDSDEFEEIGLPDKVGVFATQRQAQTLVRSILERLAPEQLPTSDHGKVDVPDQSPRPTKQVTVQFTATVDEAFDGDIGKLMPIGIVTSNASFRELAGQALIAQAESLYCTDYDIEVDPDATIAPSDEGTWVQGWLYVPDPVPDEPESDIDSDIDNDPTDRETPEP